MASGTSSLTNPTCYLQILPSAEEFWAFQKSIAADVMAEFGESQESKSEASSTI